MPSPSALPESAHQYGGNDHESRVERRAELSERNKAKQGRKRKLAESGSGFIRPTEGLRHFKLGDGLPSVHEIREELDDMTDVLKGRVEPPYPPERVESLMEVANAYYARAMEIAMLIQRFETEGVIVKAHKLSKLRTGELRTFCEMAKAVAEMGSRRITVAAMEREQRYG